MDTSKDSKTSMKQLFNTLLLEIIFKVISSQNHFEPKWFGTCQMYVSAKNTYIIALTTHLLSKKCGYICYSRRKKRCLFLKDSASVNFSRSTRTCNTLHKNIAA